MKVRVTFPFSDDDIAKLQASGAITQPRRDELAWWCLNVLRAELDSMLEEPSQEDK